MNEPCKSRIPSAMQGLCWEYGKLNNFPNVPEQASVLWGPLNMSISHVPKESSKTEQI